MCLCLEFFKICVELTLPLCITSISSHYAEVDVSVARVTEVIESAKKIVPPENIITNIEKRFMADNFADFSRKAPGTYVHAGSSDGESTSFPHHNEHFDLAEDSYHYVAALTVQYALDFLA